MGPGWRWRAQIWSIWIENELIKRFKTLPGPGEAQKNQKLSKWAKTEKTEKSVYVLPMKLPINRFGRPILIICISFKEFVSYMH